MAVTHKKVIEEGVVIPRPDPSDRTQEQLHREISWEDKLRSAKVEHVKELFQQAIASRDRAIELLQTSPTTSELAGKVDAIKELMLSMFAAVTQQTTSIKAESNEALAKALQAQERSANFATSTLKESIEKSEGQFTKQIDQQRETSFQATSNIDGKINDLKDRLTAIENRSKGIGESWGVIVAIIMAVIAAGALAAMVMKP